MKAENVALIRRQAFESVVGMVIISAVFYDVASDINAYLLVAVSAIFLWIWTYLLFSATVCLLIMSGKKNWLKSLRIEESGHRFRFGDRLIFLGGEGMLSVLTAFYSRRGKKAAMVIFVSCLLGILIWLWVKP